MHLWGIRTYIMTSPVIVTLQARRIRGEPNNTDQIALFSNVGMISVNRMRQNWRQPVKKNTNRTPAC